MPKISNVFMDRRSACGVIVAVLGSMIAWQSSASAQSGGAPQPPPDAGAGYLNVINASGLPGSMTILTNGVSLVAEGYGVGSSTGQMGFIPGKVTVKLAHPKAEKDRDVTVIVNRDQNLTLVVYTSETKDPKTGESKYQLQSYLAPHKPSPGTFSVTMVSCDPDKLIPLVKYDEQELKMTSLSPVEITLDQPKGSYDVSVNHQSIMQPLIPSQNDHHYVFVFMNRETSSPQGLVAFDFAVNSLQDEDARLRAEVEIRVARETAAAAKHDAEHLEKVMAARKEREQRRQERMAALQAKPR